MKKILLAAGAAAFLFSCSPSETKEKKETVMAESSVILDRFEDLQILKYDVDAFKSLDNRQKKLVYYLSQAALSGRDIIYAQNYRHNLKIRKTIEGVIENYSGEKSGKNWDNFMTYSKRVWFSNGIHHHYSEKKMIPKFEQSYLDELINNTPEEKLPLLGMAKADFIAMLKPVLFDPAVDGKRVNKDPKNDLVLSSATNYYGAEITQKEVEGFYKKMIDKKAVNPVSYGLNSQLTKVDGKLVEMPWKVGGMYGEAIERIVFWLEKAVKVAENDLQAKSFELLIEYYKTGDLKKWDEYNIAWVKETKGDIDVINGFIEVYGDPMGYRGAFESVVQINDFKMTEIMKVIATDAQWFEDNSPILDKHKKTEVKGVSYKVVSVAMEAGDAAPSTPIGINLPNSNWIRKDHGSKSVSLGNITDAYNAASSGGSISEFAYTEEEAELAKKYGKIGSKLHTALHEVVGHASGQLEPGVGTPQETLKNYSSTLEEARADLVALYYAMDQKLVDLGVMPSTDAGKAEYDSYIRNGLLTQLRRLELGEDIEEDHMRNRQLNALWAYEKGKAENVIEKKMKDGKTYFVINDYEKLRTLFGDLMREIQRIKSTGDYAAAKELVEGYGVKVDQELHKEVLARYAKLNSASYSGFVQPIYTPVMDGDEMIDVKVNTANDFVKQMLRYGKDYGHLTVK
ncbi:MAG: dipeptidyl-peptidase-3 [Sphingobacteriales bacterium]|jgi:dipeptidyl-peptidase-3